MSVSTVEFLLKDYLLRPIAAMVFSIVIVCGASAQTISENIEIGFEIKDSINLESFNVIGCSYVSPSANGKELTFKCPVSHVYQVEYMASNAHDLKTEYGYLQIRPDLYRGIPYVGALHYVGTYSDDKAKSVQHYNETPVNLKPIILTDVPIVMEPTGAKTIKVAAKVDEPTIEPEVITAIEQEPIVEVEPITPLVVAQVSDPAPSANNLPTIDISWDSSYGSVQINGSINVNELQEADGLIQGRIILTESVGNLFILSSSRNSNCNKAFTVEQLKEAQEVFFDCSEFTVNTPFKLPIEGEQCLHTNNTEIRAC